MLKLSKKTDYALMAVQYMSSGGADRVVNTKEIAEEYNIPVELLAKVLQKLGKKGLIVSQNGPKGGYVLAKSDRKSTRLNSSHGSSSYAVFCLKKKRMQEVHTRLTNDYAYQHKKHPTH